MFLFSRRRRHTRFAIVTGCQMWALPIFKKADDYKAWLAWALDEMDGCDILVPISSAGGGMGSEKYWHNAFEVDVMGPVRAVEAVIPGMRSEEHTSELQSLMRISYAVFCLKKKKKNNKHKRRNSNNVVIHTEVNT